ncbi:hypothetical protein BDP81DRAFT_35578 [Colletotrichum phormii]|uniref:Uncharacterized protein n=1 Tax=Colletotrichum phormii TaxID=359342 RepID=A0AAI9ZQZ8_9PEZI|nr:uncharacterized protein BDP81DRAFT_35578 [Colletotrichum phormii]KAK1636246.1 hypothetical protein BDP81DRAFT_35578 [Colletotrichum phormii]
MGFFLFHTSWHRAICFNATKSIFTQQKCPKKRNTDHTPTTPELFFSQQHSAAFYYIHNTHPNEEFLRSRDGHPRKGEGLKSQRSSFPVIEVGSGRRDIDTPDPFTNTPMKGRQRRSDCRVSRRDSTRMEILEGGRKRSKMDFFRRIGGASIDFDQMGRELLASFKEGKHAAIEHTNSSWPVYFFRTLESTISRVVDRLFSLYFDH